MVGHDEESAPYIVPSKHHGVAHDGLTIEAITIDVAFVLERHGVGALHHGKLALSLAVIGLEREGGRALLVRGIGQYSHLEVVVIPLIILLSQRIRIGSITHHPIGIGVNRPRLVTMN